MRSTEDITHIINTLSYISLPPKTVNYISLPPKNEQVIELDKVIYHIKNINKDKRFSISYKKLLDKVKYLLILNGYEKVIVIQ